MATYYVDGVSGSDGNAGTSFGAAWATLGKAASTAVAGDTVIVCATGTYTLTATVSWSTNGDTTTGPITITGGNASGTVDGTRPTITSGTNSVHLFTLAGTDYLTFRYLTLTHTASTRGDGIRNTTGDSLNIRVENCIIDGCQVGVDETFSFTNTAIVASQIKNCVSHGVGIAGAGLVIDGCDIRSNGGAGCNGLFGANTYTFLKTNFYGNTYGIRATSNGGYSQRIIVDGCNFRGATNSGIDIAETSATFELILQNSKFYGNGAYGINLACTTVIGDARTVVNRSNAYGGNTSGARNHLSAGTGDVTLTADPDTSTSDFTLNNTAGGGAACRAAGFPGVFPGGTTTGYLDIGAVQHQDAGGGSITYVINNNQTIYLPESY